ncbi:MAG: ATP-dependent DNA helicase RecG [Cytophagales bacterium]|nr:ATP-dependent DNA helicase RecG [Cytophagales bacterium]
MSASSIVNSAQKPTPTYAQKALAKLGLVRDIDFALHLPLRYEDETHMTALRDARHGETVQIEAVVTSCEIQSKGKRQLVVTVVDGEPLGRGVACTLRFFNFYPSHQRALAVGERLRIRGEVKRSLLGLSMLHPSFKPAGGDLAQVLTAVYPTSAGLPQGYIRKAVWGGLLRATQRGDLSETLALPQLPSLQAALELLHHPTPDVSVATLEDRSHPAWQRLKAEELLAQQLSQLQARRERAKMRAHTLPVRIAPVGIRPSTSSDRTADGLPEQLLGVLPFALTHAQERVQREIATDLTQSKPMNRLLQGDVGSGKTVVAALAAAQCIAAGCQCALMVPTEILAQQHFAKLVGWLEPLLAARGLSVAWLSGTQKTKERREMLAKIASGEAALVVGTHAIIQNKVTFTKLALVIVDEQHRFGVAQRLALKEKTQGTMHPHLLMMSATPIPRTLAMSYYADLDVSTIDELPPGRTPIVTKIVAMAKRDEVVRRIIDQLKAGRQVYWVCPLIEESEAVDLVNATETHAALQAALHRALPSARVALLHSKVPALEKKALMQAFEKNDVQVLVSTTVIEVGVDVPNATLMVIEHAERFGLAQLHQLRGRVGRGLAASACVLLYATNDSGKLGDAAKARLKAMVDTTDGFEIARRDLHIRGPGEFLGARQSGAQMLRFADLSQAPDQAWLKWAQATAPVMLDSAPQMAARHIERWLPSGASFMGA